MGTYGLEGVMHAWEMEKLTTEQAVGQILQLMVEIDERLRDLENKYNRISRQRTRASRLAGSQEHENEEREA